MDTRSKIVSGDDARKQSGDAQATWVTGDFDPLLSEHVRRLRQQAIPGRLLIVEVTNLVKPLLPQRARAELVAALTMVDYVVLGNGTATPQGIDASVTERFIQKIVERHRGEGAG